MKPVFLAVLLLAGCASITPPDFHEGHWWEPHPTAKRCAPEAIKWVHVKGGPAPHGYEAAADWDTCTITSIYSEAEAEAMCVRMTLLSPCIPGTSVRKHEREHLLEASRHPSPPRDPPHQLNTRILERAMR